MASTIAAQEVPSGSGRLFYCHRCSHQWRKTENSDFVCPQCREGFIEDINDNSNPQRERSNSVISMISRIISDIPPLQRIPGSSRDRATRARSRSPRIREFYIGTTDRGGTGSSSSTSFSTSVPRLADFHFDLDDLMNSFLSTPRPPPLSQRRLDEIQVMPITIEESTTQCSVCFEEFTVNEGNVRRLPCNHMFHELCIFPWLRINGTCPVCRARLSRDRDEDNAAPPTRDASRYDEILRFMRLRRHVRRGNVGSDSSSSPPVNNSTPVVLAPSSSEHALDVPERAISTSIIPTTGASRRILLNYNRHNSDFLRSSARRHDARRARTLRSRILHSPVLVDLTSSDSDTSGGSPLVAVSPTERNRETNSSSPSSSSSSSSRSSSSSPASVSPIPSDESIVPPPLDFWSDPSSNEE